MSDTTKSILLFVAAIVIVKGIVVYFISFDKMITL